MRWEKTDLGENCLTVQDTGIGCSSELLDHIFDPFVVEDFKQFPHGRGETRSEEEKTKTALWKVRLGPNIM